MENELKGIYHLSCPHCFFTWWSYDAFPEYCPYCKKKLQLIVGERKDAK